MAAPDGLVPLTEIEAVNVMLATGADNPISTLEDDQIIDASLARNTLRAVLVEVQTLGWAFNTEFNWTITPDQNGNIILPRNTLKITSSSYVQRGTKLYDKNNRSYVFGQPVTLDVTVGLPYEELPPIVANYCIIRAARKYQDQYFGDQAAHSYSIQDEYDARSKLMEFEIDCTKPNMLNDSQFIQDLLARS